MHMTFSVVREEDLFGQLMTQLAQETQRKLLGQEWTPHWVAKALAAKCLNQLDDSESPAFVDTCCGSGAIISEVLKLVKEVKPEMPLEGLGGAVTGFDIDPLAVILAKTTWVITLADEIRGSSGQVVVPVYHADSLFAVTPLTSELPFAGGIGRRSLLNLMESKSRFL